MAIGLSFAAAPALAQSPSAAVVPQGGNPVPQLAPAAPPAVGPGLRGPGSATPGATPAGNVAVRGLAFEGATAFPESRLSAAAGQVTGPSVPVSAMENARAAIVTLYREAGYPFVTADASLGADGVLRFRIAEGYIAEVSLDGDIGPAGTQVLRFLNRLRDIRPLNVETLERQLLLAQDVPGVSLRSVLRPSGTAPGALSLVAQVQRRAVSGYVTADNRGSRFTGPFQALAAVQLNSFTELGERTEFAFFYGNGATQLFGQASTEVFIGSSGLRVRLYAGRGRAHPSDALRALGYEGETTIGGLAVTYPLIRSRSQTLNLVGNFDAIESEIEIDGANGRSTRFSRDSLRILRLGGDWAVYDLLAGDTRPGSNLFTLRLSQGLDILGAENTGDPDASRAGAETDFTKIAFEITRNQALFTPWTGALVSLQATVAGQWTNDILPQSEKFYLGGNRLGRGYYSGEVTGDRAFATSLELQLSMSAIETTVFGRALRFDPVVYAFYDYGRTWENLSSDPDRRLESTGLGLRLGINERLEAQVEGVHRMSRRPSGGNARPEKEDALFWRVLARF
ncbi:ShlB/FhaC/HecB family hemolysin secretion/activation protein [Muricoccus radiodurans]|uniref:ShlB/FhaC/HecB family hemolysin secretion/activation protein n=1 Tax=Muricoccus radiodurans TaxID=2231721 RepID=UPI003CF8AEBB